MDLIALQPPPGVWRGIDTVVPITREIARSLRHAGYRWGARYVRLDGRVLSRPHDTGDYRGCWSISLGEQSDMLAEGLALLPIQYGTFGAPAQGEELGAAMVTAARGYGWARGTTVWIDVEGGAPLRAGAGATIAYIEAWARIVTAARYRAGLYAPGGIGLTGAQLYGLAGITCYWAGARPRPEVPLPRGYAVEQDPPTQVCGIPCDTDTIRADRSGEGPYLVADHDTALGWYGHALGQLAGSQYLLPSGGDIIA